MLWQANQRGAGGERKAPLQAALHNSSAGSSFLSRGLTRRLRRGSGTCRSMGRSIALSGYPKGCRGERREELPLGNPVCLWQTELFKLNLKSSPSSSGYNRRRRLAPRSSRKQQAERTSVRAAPIVCPEESPLLATIGDNFAVSKSPLVGIDAPTPARGQGLQPYGALTLFFRWRKKMCKRKPAARRLQRRPAPLRVIRKYRRSGHCRARLLYLLRPASR